MNLDLLWHTFINFIIIVAIVLPIVGGFMLIEEWIYNIKKCERCDRRLWWFICSFKTLDEKMMCCKCHKKECYRCGGKKE